MRIFSIFLLFFMLLLGGVSFITAQEEAPAMPAFSDLEAGIWNRIDPGGDTLCMYGTDFNFFVRPAIRPSDKLMIYFEGGGACWNGETCGAIGQFASSYEAPENISNLDQGIWDFANSMNPVADYNMVYVPYCTGDVHSGDSVVTYEVPAELGADFDEITVHFNGYTNGSTVLSWVYENFIAPEQVFVTGCSAGGYGATYHASGIMAHYADSRVVHLADAASGVGVENWDGLDQWDTAANLPDAYGFTTPLEFKTFNTDLTVAMANAFPQNQFAQINTFLDQVQVVFFGLQAGYEVNEQTFPDIAGEWAQGLITNLLRADLLTENFNYYTAGGLQHCIIPREELYNYEVNGALAAEWIANLLDPESEKANTSCDFRNGECLQAPASEE